jgi:hypothetical protein
VCPKKQHPAFFGYPDTVILPGAESDLSAIILPAESTAFFRRCLKSMIVLTNYFRKSSPGRKQASGGMDFKIFRF